MTWEEFKNLKFTYETTNYKKTQIECPKCGAPLFMRTDVVLTTYPVQYQYVCKECGWVGHSFNKA